MVVERVGIEPTYTALQGYMNRKMHLIKNVIQIIKEYDWFPITAVYLP